MRIIARRTLQAFWEDPRYRDAEQPLRAWHTEVKRAGWRTPAQIKAAHRSASVLANRVVFNIAGNRYRLVVAVKYTAQIVFVRFVGTHARYDAIDAEGV